MPTSRADLGDLLLASPDNGQLVLSNEPRAMSCESEGLCNIQPNGIPWDIRDNRQRTLGGYRSVVRSLLSKKNGTKRDKTGQNRTKQDKPLK